MDAALKERLNLFETEKLARPEVIRFVEHTVAWLEHETGRELTEENGGTLVTHVTLAFERILSGEALGDAWSPLVHQEAVNNERALGVSAELAKSAASELGIEVPNEEIDFITLHVAAFLLAN